MVGSQLFDPCRKAILLRGVNKMFVFEQQVISRLGTKILPEIAKTGANCVRIVWGMNRKKANGVVVPTSVQELDSIISTCKSLKMIPIVGLWDFTGDQPDSGFSQLSQYVDYWVRPDVLALLKKHDNALILNIANEAAPECDDSDEQINALVPNYIASYSTAVVRMRAEGINVPLNIDGLDFGKSLKCFSFIQTGKNINVATELLKSDILKTLFFHFIHIDLKDLLTVKHSLKTYLIKRLKINFALLLENYQGVVLGLIKKVSVLKTGKWTI